MLAKQAYVHMFVVVALLLPWLGSASFACSTNPPTVTPNRPKSGGEKACAAAVSPRKNFGSFDPFKDFDGVCQYFTDRLVVCPSLEDALLKAQEWASHLDPNPDNSDDSDEDVLQQPMADARLQRSWSSRLAQAALDDLPGAVRARSWADILMGRAPEPPTLPSDPEEAFSVIEITAVHVDRQSKDLKLAILLILQSLCYFSYERSGAHPGGSAREPYDPSEHGTIMPINDWHDLLLILGEFHPFMLPVVRSLCPWFATTPVVVKTAWQVLEYQNSLCQLAKAGFALKLDPADFRFVSIVNSLFWESTEDVLVLMRFATYFDLPNVTSTVTFEADAENWERLAKGPSAPSYLQGHSWARIRNGARLFSAGGRKDVPIIVPADGFVMRRDEDLTPVKQAILRILPSIIPAASSNPPLLNYYPSNGSPSNTSPSISSSSSDSSSCSNSPSNFQSHSHVGDLGDFIIDLALNDHENEDRFKDTVLSITSFADASTPYTRQSLIAIVVGIPGHAIGWLLDLRHRHLYVTDRQNEAGLDGVLRYALRQAPTLEQWHAIWKASQTAIPVADYSALLVALTVPKSERAIRVLSRQHSDSCQLQAQLAMLRLTLTLVLHHDYGVDHARVRMIYKRIVRMAREMIWMVTDEQQASTDYMYEAIVRAKTSALLSGDIELFGFLQSDSNARMIYDLYPQVTDELIVELRRDLFLKFRRLQSTIHGLEAVERHSQGQHPIDPIVPDQSSVSISARDKYAAKADNWRNYATLGEDYLQFVVDNPNGQDPFLVVLGRCLLFKVDDLPAYVDGLSEAERRRIRRLATEWRGYTLIDALLYGHFCHAELEKTKACNIGDDVFFALYDLQYGPSDWGLRDNVNHNSSKNGNNTDDGHTTKGSGINWTEWRRWIGAPMLAVRHHMHLFVVPQNGQRTPALALCYASVASQQHSVIRSEWPQISRILLRSFPSPSKEQGDDQRTMTEEEGLIEQQLRPAITLDAIPGPQFCLARLRSQLPAQQATAT
jgi:hypothetical protein